MNALFIFDWDDTLFPTSWVIKNRYSLKDHKLKSYFDYLDKLVSRILFNTMKLGNVIIVTNASIRWINDCLEALPLIKKLTKIIPVLSARDKYSNKYPTKIEYWKKNTFSEITFKKQHKQVISIGDNESEYLALIHIMEQKYCDVIKSLKFKSFPSDLLLIDQLLLLEKSLIKVVRFDSNLDLVIMG